MQSLVSATCVWDMSTNDIERQKDSFAVKWPSLRKTFLYQGWEGHQEIRQKAKFEETNTYWWLSDLIKTQKLWMLECLKKKGLCGKKLLECKLRGPPNFSNDTDCISSLLINQLP